MWKPIQTAHKDGGYIIAARFRNGNELCWVRHSRWITAEECADEWGGEPEDYEAGWCDGGNTDEPINPTHWMPLETPIQETQP